MRHFERRERLSRATDFPISHNGLRMVITRRYNGRISGYAHQDGVKCGAAATEVLGRAARAVPV